MYSGTHHYYNMTRDLNCEDMYHWFVLFDGDKLIGTGYQSFGKIKNETPKSRSWFEKFPKTEQGIKVIYNYLYYYIYNYIINPIVMRGITAIFIRTKPLVFFYDC